MSTKHIKWDIGDGYIHLTYDGNGNGTISISSDVNSGGGRSQEVIISTNVVNGKQVVKKLTINQPGINEYDGQWASTPDSEYISRLNCEGADSTFDSQSDTLADGGGASSS